LALDAGPQPSQYRPATQKDAWKPEPPLAGRRIDPLTGRDEPRAFPKSYGCDGGVDYGVLYTMRSGTAAVYDKGLESGTLSISGPRSGCTNSVIPAAGVLNVPYFYEGCTCSYPLPSALALVAMPETHEQWTIWGAWEPAAIRRVGLNFGAPGDRRTRDGTLWLDHPSVGGPSPAVDVRIEGDAKPYYRHSVWYRGGDGWPWVQASGIESARSVRVAGLVDAEFTVRLFFCASDDSERRFDVAVDGATIASDFAPLERAGGAMRGVVVETRARSSDGAIRVDLEARAGTTILSGLELIAIEGE